MSAGFSIFSPRKWIQKRVNIMCLSQHTGNILLQCKQPRICKVHFFMRLQDSLITVCLEHMFRNTKYIFRKSVSPVKVLEKFATLQCLNCLNTYSLQRLCSSVRDFKSCLHSQTTQEKTIILMTIYSGSEHVLVYKTHQKRFISRCPRAIC